MWRRQPWRRLIALARQLPPSSPWVLRETNGESAWQIQEQLLALAVDVLALANWQRGGGKGRRPKPIERPGVKSTSDETTFGGVTTYSVEEMRRILDGEDGTTWVEMRPGEEA